MAFLISRKIIVYSINRVCLLANYQKEGKEEREKEMGEGKKKEGMKKREKRERDKKKTGFNMNLKVNCGCIKSLCIKNEN